MSRLRLHSPLRMPVLDALAGDAPVWLGSQAELLERYPHLGPIVTAGRTYRISCLPIIVHGRRLGCLAFTFEGPPVVQVEQRYFKQLIARYAGQALERLRLLDAERHSRALAESAAARTEAARHRAELLYRLVHEVNAATTAEQVYEAAMDAIERGLAAPRSAILAFDAAGVMRFRAWRGLSDTYRAAVEGHSPWGREVREPRPVVVADVEQEPTLGAFLPVLRREGIAALGFHPLVSSGRLIGKFMVYHDRPHTLGAHELEMAQAIADHAATAMTRFANLAELQQTVHFNEMFTGMLGHDLRNPLGAIMTSAQLTMRRTTAENLVKPLSRILSSGERMARMIDQLLDFTRIRVGSGIRIEPQPVDLWPLLRQVIDELEGTHPGVMLRLQLKEGSSTTGLWDADRLSQVFSNLVANAVRHGISEHGVTITVDGRAADGVQVWVHNMGGIALTLLPTLFEPMTTSERRRDRSQGLGLGLYISQQIVQAHRGQIEVTSDEVSGTTFAVRLPRRVETQERPS
jgi:signal transduction histidine kinase